MNDKPEWFAAKRYGIGAGLPISWQGWAATFAFFGLIGLAFLLFGPEDLRALAIVIPAALAFVLIAALTTKGGWRWRWGGDEQ